MCCIINPWLPSARLRHGMCCDMPTEQAGLEEPWPCQDFGGFGEVGPVGPLPMLPMLDQVCGRPLGAS